MKSIVLATSAIVLASVFSAPASAGTGPQPQPPSFLEGCHVPAGAQKQAEKGNLRTAWKIIASANTDAGDGNGGETASIFGCASGLGTEDSSVNIDATDAPGFATDPGNSDQGPN